MQAAWLLLVGIAKRVSEAQLEGTLVVGRQDGS
jgi:hypothetical protein